MKTTINYLTQVHGMSEEIIKFAKEHNILFKSPYSNSFYSNGKKTWNYTEIGTIRISDHWNFLSQNKIHCKTSSDVCKNHWSICIYNDKKGMYDVLLSVPFSNEIREKRNNRYYNFFNELSCFNEKKESRIVQLNYSRYYKKQNKRAKKIKNGTLWVEFEKNHGQEAQGQNFKEKN
jgi:hypothetical protein